MPGYRAADGEPVVVVLDGNVVGIDIESGARLWSLHFANVERLLAQGDRLYVCAGKFLHCVDKRTGEQVGSIALDFPVSAAIMRGDRILVAGPEGAACFTVQGSKIWSAAVKYNSKKLLSLSRRLECVNAAGRPLWENPLAQGAVAVALVAGDDVVQPDFTA